jgi:DNA-binding Xre family transcriptional regulator
MLDLDVVRVMNLRGISARHYAHLAKNGFGRSTASKMVRNQTWAIRFDLLEKLCLLFNCTPNDLFEWKPDENQTVGENTALKSLVRDKTESEINQMVKELPLEKLEKMKTMLARLKEED